jgi:hypothetical protein
MSEAREPIQQSGIGMNDLLWFTLVAALPGLNRYRGFPL